MKLCSLIVFSIVFEEKQEKTFEQCFFIGFYCWTQTQNCRVLYVRVRVTRSERQHINFPSAVSVWLSQLFFFVDFLEFSLFDLPIKSHTPGIFFLDCLH